MAGLANNFGLGDKSTASKTTKASILGSTPLTFQIVRFVRAT